MQYFFFLFILPVKPSESTLIKVFDYKGSKGKTVTKKNTSLMYFFSESKKKNSKAEIDYLLFSLNL